MTRQQALQIAVDVIRNKTLHGADRETLRRTTEGYVAPGEPGYDIRAGHITVPASIRLQPRFSFATDDLMDEVEQGQGDLFGLCPHKGPTPYNQSF